MKAKKTNKKGKVPKKGKLPRKANSGKSQQTKKSSKRQRLFVPTNNREKLVDLKLMKPQSYLSETKPTMTVIRGLTQVAGNQYEVGDQACVSTILKLVLKVHQTNELSDSWSLALWNINQRGLLPEGASVTFVRSFERRDNDTTKKNIKKRRRLAILSSDNGENVTNQSASVAHDLKLWRAINSGDSVVAFAAEVLVTAPNEYILEEAVSAITDYLSSNDETRGLQYAMDVNRLAQPLITFGPNKPAGNQHLSYEMSSYDAAISALFVDSGGDRTIGSEYVGVSVGKLISSHAAYNFQAPRSLFVGNDTINTTHTLAVTNQEPSQIYLSKVASRSYLLKGQKVVHFVCDHLDSVDHLMNFGLDAHNKIRIDVSKGLLNLMEPIKSEYIQNNPERVISHFPSHLNNIIALLGQFRGTKEISTTDNFADITRDILIDFFTSNKYWVYDAQNHLEDIRFYSKHEQYKMLKDFGAYVAQRMKVNQDGELKGSLSELNNIINRTILPTIPSLNTKTDPIIDVMVDTKYRVLDLTGMGQGVLTTIDNPSMNVMAIAYLNILLPAMKNGDLIVFHGMSRMTKIAGLLQDIISNSGVNIDILFTESNQKSAIKTLDVLDTNLDFAMVQLFENRVDKLYTRLGIDSSWSQDLAQEKAAYYVRTRSSSDYIYLDHIL